MQGHAALTHCLHIAQTIAFALPLATPRHRAPLSRENKGDIA